MRRVLLAALALGLGATGTAFAADAPVSGLAPGLAARTLIRAGDLLEDGTRVPVNTDFTAYLPGAKPGAGTLMIGHEIRWGADAFGGRFTKLRLEDLAVKSGQAWVSGMHNNCAGTVTPWGTILSGEEFPNRATGQSEADYERVAIQPTDPEADFGWIYEIDPRGENPAGKARRLTALGRFSHESALVMPDRRTVYLTEDYPAGHLYRFHAAAPRDLSRGALMAYDRQHARWLPIADPYNARLEATRKGATAFNRLEDLQLAPDGKHVVFAETGDPAKDPYGRLWRLSLTGDRASVLLEGDGKALANPDNLMFLPSGDLLVCEDQFDTNVARFGRNAILRLKYPQGPLSRVLETTVGEPSGPSYDPETGTFFFSVLAHEKSQVVAVSGLR